MMPKVFSSNDSNSLTLKLEQKIFSLLDFKTLHIIKQVNKNWHTLSTTELQKQSVRVIIWPPKRIPDITIENGNLHSYFPSEGHAALRTYVGGADNRGIYASFWPGKCVEWNRNRADDPYLCHNDKSHFHTPDHDALTKPDPSSSPINIDLYCLNIDA